LGRFRGEIHQTPSMYSAIKKDGQPLYKLARQGIEVEREARPVTIFELVLRGMGPETLDLGVHCSKGTYIRSLAEDIGTELGCGAHVAELRRTGVGQFSIEDAVSMDTVVGRSGDGPEGMDPLLLPIQEAVVNLPRVELSEHTGAYLLQGQPVQVTSAPKAGLVQLFHSLGTEDRFIGIGEVLDDGKIAPRRLIAAQ
jgi:tRNA pseudouridine55 synthase